MVTGAVALQQAVGKGVLGGKEGLSDEVEVLVGTIQASLEAVRESLGV